MLIHLMQHGACLPKGLDKHQALSPVGKEQIVKSAKAARILGLQFQLIVTSPKDRARQTAEIMAHYIGYPASRIEVSDVVKAMSPPQDALEYIKEYEGLDSILVVGHLPSLGLLAASMLTNSQGLAINVENGGLMQLALTDFNKKATLNWHISPAQLSQIVKD